MDVVLGFRPHTYWTATATLAGSSSAPGVLARRRINFAHGDKRLVYHHAAEGRLADAPALLAGGCADRPSSAG